MPAQRFSSFPRADAPGLYVVARAGDDRLSIGREGERRGPVPEALERIEALAAGDAPEPDDLVAMPRCHRLAIPRDRQPPDPPPGDFRSSRTQAMQPFPLPNTNDLGSLPARGPA